MSAPILPIIDSRPDRTKEYAPAKPILDRILVRRIAAAIPADGFIVPEKYRQHDHWGEVISVGDYVVMGQQCLKMSDFVQPGDRVRYSEYTAEQYAKDDDALWIIRLQDVRIVEKLING